MSPKSETLYDLYVNKLDKICPSDVKQVQGDAFLPEMVLCHNQDVLCKRKKPKTLETIDFDDSEFDFQFSKVVLFRNHQDISTLTEQQVVQSFEETDDHGEKIVCKNER